jgi:putative tricarboxylic transport membrane protein
MRKTLDMIIAAVCIVVGILMFWFTRQFEFGGLQDFGTGFWPRIIATILIACSVGMFFRALLSKDPKMKEIVVDWKSKGMRKVYAAFGVMVLFCVVLHFLGLLIAIFFMIIGIMLVMGERRPLFLICTPVGMTLFIFVAFQVLLKLSLPTGILL